MPITNKLNRVKNMKFLIQKRALCQRCGVKPALYKYNGKVRADKEHDLCFRCYRIEREKIKVK